MLLKLSKSGALAEASKVLLLDELTTFLAEYDQVVMPTVEADVSFGLGKFDLALDEVRSRVSNALDAVGMLEYSQMPIQTLSGGQKQRVAIAGALAEASKVLLLDELTTFLDEYDQIYPTSLRSSGYGTASAVGRVDGILSPLVAVALLDGCHQAEAIFLFEVIIGLSAIAVAFFPFETSGRSLDDSL